MGRRQEDNPKVEQHLVDNPEELLDNPEEELPDIPEVAHHQVDILEEELLDNPVERQQVDNLTVELLDNPVVELQGNPVERQQEDSPVEELLDSLGEELLGIQEEVHPDILEVGRLGGLLRTVSTFSFPLARAEAEDEALHPSSLPCMASS